MVGRWQDKQILTIFIYITIIFTFNTFFKPHRYHGKWPDAIHVSLDCTLYASPTLKMSVSTTQAPVSLLAVC